MPPFFAEATFDSQYFYWLCNILNVFFSFYQTDSHSLVFELNALLKFAKQICRLSGMLRSYLALENLVFNDR